MGMTSLIPSRPHPYVIEPLDTARKCCYCPWMMCYLKKTNQQTYKKNKLKKHTYLGLGVPRQHFCAIIVLLFPVLPCTGTWYAAQGRNMVEITIEQILHDESFVSHGEKVWYRRIIECVGIIEWVDMFKSFLKLHVGSPSMAWVWCFLPFHPPAFNQLMFRLCYCFLTVWVWFFWGCGVIVPWTPWP